MKADRYFTFPSWFHLLDTRHIRYICVHTVALSTSSDVMRTEQLVKEEAVQEQVAPHVQHVIPTYCACERLQPTVSMLQPGLPDFYLFY